MKPEIDHPDPKATIAAVARVETDRALWYLGQLCTHATKMGGHLPRLGTHRAGGHATAEVLHVERSGVDGVMTFSLGRCNLHAAGDRLTLRLEASSDEDLKKLQNLIGHRLQTIGSRDRVVVDWHRLDD